MATEVRPGDYRVCPKCGTRHKVHDLRCTKCQGVLAGTPVHHASMMEGTRAGRHALARVEEGAVEGEDLSGRIETAVREANELISQMTRRLAGLAHGTTAFSRAMHDVAVSDENHSKNIADIAATASALTDASARISELVGTFKLGGS